MTIYVGGKANVTVSGVTMGRAREFKVEIDKSVGREEVIGRNTDYFTFGNRKPNASLTMIWYDDTFTDYAEDDDQTPFEVTGVVKTNAGVTHKTITLSNCVSSTWGTGFSTGGEPIEEEIDIECEDFSFT